MKWIKLFAVAAIAVLAASPLNAQPKPEKKQTCCQQAVAEGKECKKRCCLAAHSNGKSCQKCNPAKEDQALLEKGRKKAEKP